jgi:hypothetical protein
VCEQEDGGRVAVVSLVIHYFLRGTPPPTIKYLKS